MSINVLKDPGNAILDIVLVPGLKVEGKPEWTSENESTIWPQTLLPQKVPKARILTFEYEEDLTIDVFWNERDGDLSGHADSLIGALVAERQDEAAKKRPIVFIAHCLGGLALQFALQRASEDDSIDILDRTAMVLLLGTPHYSTESIEKAKPFFQLAGRDLPAKAELANLSVHLLKITEAFAKLRQDNSINVRTYYGNSPIYIESEKVYVVDESEAKQPGKSPAPRSMKGNHHQISRFESEKPDFQKVAQALAEVVGNLPTQEAKGGGGTNIAFGGHNSGFQIGQNNGQLKGFNFGKDK